MKELFKEVSKTGFRLFIIGFACVLILAFIKEATKADYIATMKKEETKSMKAIFKDADKFAVGKIGNKTVTFAIKNGKKYGILAFGNGKGFGGNVLMLVGAEYNNGLVGKIKGIMVVRHQETPGLGTKAKEPWFKNAFKGKLFKDLPQGAKDFKSKMGIDTITGATITSMAVLNGVKNAMRKMWNKAEIKSGATKKK